MNLKKLIQENDIIHPISYEDFRSKVNDFRKLHNEIMREYSSDSNQNNLKLNNHYKKYHSLMSEFNYPKNFNLEKTIEVINAGANILSFFKNVLDLNEKEYNKLQNEILFEYNLMIYEHYYKQIY